MSHDVSSIGVRELRQQASAVLRRVRSGETIEVTDHGHPIARIVPLRSAGIDQLVLEGRATPAGADLVNLAEELRLPAEPLGTLPSAALSELRLEER